MSELEIFHRDNAEIKKINCLLFGIILLGSTS